MSSALTQDVVHRTCTHTIMKLRGDSNKETP